MTKAWSTNIYCRARSAYTTTTQVNNGPAIRMLKADHLKTNSWGNTADARKYQAAQAKLVADGQPLAALNMDIQDIKKRYPKKYDKALEQMLSYEKNKLGWRK